MCRRLSMIGLLALAGAACSADPSSPGPTAGVGTPDIVTDAETPPDSAGPEDTTTPEDTPQDTGAPGDEKEDSDPPPPEDATATDGGLSAEEVQPGDTTPEDIEVEEVAIDAQGPEVDDFPPDGCEGIDCDDGDPCTGDLCIDGSCSHPPLEGTCVDWVNPHKLVIHFSHAEDGPDGKASMQTVQVSVPEGTTQVLGQLAIRGDLNYFPAAFQTLVVEQDGSLAQCGDVSGLPQLPNNFKDDVFRVAWPRPENLDPSSIFYPPAPPWDHQPLPCQEGFEGKDMVEVGIVSSGINPPGVGDNQGPGACGGAGCPNNVRVTLLFEPGPQPDPSCTPGEDLPCLCPDGTFGKDTCAPDGSGPADQCVCDIFPVDPQPPEGPTAGLCVDPVALPPVGPEHPEVIMAMPGTDFHIMPWPPGPVACPASKPPYGIDFTFTVQVAKAGQLEATLEVTPAPWSPNQHFIDLQMACEIPWACAESNATTTSFVLEGELLVGVTLVPPGEVYLPDQDDWEAVITLVWSPL